MCKVLLNEIYVVGEIEERTLDNFLCSKNKMEGDDFIEVFLGDNSVIVDKNEVKIILFLEIQE